MIETSKVTDGVEVEMIRVPSPAKYYAAGLAWLAYSLFFPLYAPVHFVIAATVSISAYFIAKRIWPWTTELRKVKPKEYSTGDEGANALLEECEGHLARLRVAAADISGTSAAQKAERILALCRQMLDYVEKNPRSAQRIRRFANYYLPTVVKLLGHYAGIVSRRAKGENMAESAAKIEDMLDMIIAALTKQIDGLFQDDALDISPDITALENMLALEGLTGSPANINRTSAGND